MDSSDEWGFRKASRMSSMPATQSRPHTQACLQKAHKRTARSGGASGSYSATGALHPNALHFAVPTRQTNHPQRVHQSVVENDGCTYCSRSGQQTARGTPSLTCGQKLTFRAGATPVPCTLIQSLLIICSLSWTCWRSWAERNSHLSTAGKEIADSEHMGGRCDNSQRRSNDAVAGGRLPGQASRPGGALLPGPPPAAAQPAAATLHAQPAVSCPRSRDRSRCRRWVWASTCTGSGNGGCPCSRRGLLRHQRRHLWRPGSQRRGLRRAAARRLPTAGTLAGGAAAGTAVSVALQQAGHCVSPLFFSWMDRGDVELGHGSTQREHHQPICQPACVPAGAGGAAAAAGAGCRAGCRDGQRQDTGLPGATGGPGAAQQAGRGSR